MFVREKTLQLITTKFYTIVPQIEAAFERSTLSRLSAVPAFLSVSTQIALASRNPRYKTFYVRNL
jgi:hypothetical protein